MPFTRRSWRCRSDSASFCGRRGAGQQPAPCPESCGRDTAATQTPSHRKLLSCPQTSLQKTGHRSSFHSHCLPRAPMEPLPRAWVPGEAQQSCPMPICPLHSQDHRTALELQKCWCSHSAIFTSYSLGAAEQLIPLLSCISSDSHTATEQRATLRCVSRPTPPELLYCRMYTRRGTGERNPVCVLTVIQELLSVQGLAEISIPSC